MRLVATNGPTAVREVPHALSLQHKELEVLDTLVAAPQSMSFDVESGRLLTHDVGGAAVAGLMPSNERLLRHDTRSAAAGSRSLDGRGCRHAISRRGASQNLEKCGGAGRRTEGRTSQW